MNEAQWGVPKYGLSKYSPYGRVLWSGHGQVLLELSESPERIEWKGATAYLVRADDVAVFNSREDAGRAATKFMLSRIEGEALMARGRKAIDAAWAAKSKSK